MIFAILFGGAVYVVLNTITASVMPWETLISAGYDWPTGEAVEVIMGKAGLIFLGSALICAVMTGIIGFYMATSRLLYSMAKENVLPAWFGVLHSKYKTPTNAILFVLLISVIAPFFGRTALGWIVDMSSIGAAIGYGYTSLAAFKFAKDAKNTGIMITGIVGSIMALIFVILLLVPIPMFNCSLGKESYISLVIWIVIGAFFYYSTKKAK
jgi:amino acid transporter